MTKLSQNRLYGSKFGKTAPQQRLHHEEQSKAIADARSEHERETLKPKPTHPEFSLFVEDWHHRSSEHSVETASNKVRLSTAQNLSKSDKERVSTPSADRLRIPKFTKLIELKDPVSLGRLSELHSPTRRHRDTERVSVVALKSQNAIDMPSTSSSHSASSASSNLTQQSTATKQDPQVPVVSTAVPKGLAVVTLESPMELNDLKELSSEVSLRRFEWRTKNRLNKEAKESKVKIVVRSGESSTRKR